MAVHALLPIPHYITYIISLLVLLIQFADKDDNKTWATLKPDLSFILLPTMDLKTVHGGMPYTYISIS